MKKYSIVQGIFLCMLLLLSTSFAERLPIFDAIGREEGLPNLSISSIVQDKNGFLWIGTQGGLARFDGKAFEVYRNDPFDETGLMHNLIQTLYYDSNSHSLWIGTYQGASYLDIDSNTFTHYTVEENQLSNPVVVSILKDSKGDVWLGTLDGLNRIKNGTHEIETFDVPGKVVRSILEASNGTLYFASYEGLLSWNANNDSLEKVALDLPASALMVLKEFSPDVLTIGMWEGGITEVNLKTLEMTHITFEDNRIYTIEKSSNGTLWAGSWGGGLFALDASGQKHHFPATGKKNALMHPIIYSLFESDSGILWVGTNGGGLHKLNPLKNNFHLLSHDPDDDMTLSPGKINAIYKDDKGYLYVAVYNEGINRFSPSLNTVERFTKDNSTLIDNNVVQFLPLNAETVLLATNSGVMRYDILNESLHEYPLEGIDGIVYALAINDQSHVYVGTYNDGVHVFDSQGNALERPKNLSNNLVYTMLYDSKNRLWVGTNNGLNLLEQNAHDYKHFYRVQGDRQQIASNTIRSLFEDRNGTIWVGTNGGGVSKYIEETGSFVTYTEAEGLSSNTILGILQSDDGKIWLSTQSGLSILDPVTGDIEILTDSDGIGGYEFNAGHFKDNAGTLYFGGAHGVTAIPALHRSNVIYRPKMYIYGIELFQTPLSSVMKIYNNDHMVFQANENYLGFRFVAIDYDAPDKLQYYHKLVGQDQDFIAVGHRDYVSYSNLPPGNYTFVVYAETYRGTTTDPVEFHFKIRTPIYLTPIAFIVYILLAYYLFRIAYKLRESHIIKVQNSQLATINRKLEDANTKLETLSIQDPLTGVYNRRYFSDVFEQHLHLAKRGNTSISMLMLDVDDFKLVNDELGHVEGDKVLKVVAEGVCKHMLRSTDFVARFGGDEFVVALYDTNAEGALSVARAIMKELEGLVSVSIGICTITPSENVTVEHVIQRADKALYLAKNAGKGRIEVD